MWRSLQFAAPKQKGAATSRLPRCLYATSTSQSGTSGKKAVITFIAVTGLGAGATIAYAKYDPKFRKIIEANVPYSDVIFKSLPDLEQPRETPTLAVGTDQKISDSAIEPSLLKKKQERLKKVEKSTEAKPETKPPDPVKQQEDKRSESPSILKPVVTDDKTLKESVNEPPKPIPDDSIVFENSIKDLLGKTEKSAKEALSAQEAALEAIKIHTTKLYQALDTPGDVELEQSWKEADIASSKEATAIMVAGQKVSAAQRLLEKLKAEIQKGHENGAFAKSSVLFTGESVASQLEKQLKEAEAKVAAAQMQSQTAENYKDLVNKAREQFRNELQIVLPKYVHKNKDQSMTEDELNLLIAHAHRRIEHLQKELAKQQVTEKQRIEEAKCLQKSEDDRALELRIASEISRYHKKMEVEYQKQLDLMQDEFEADMRQQLRRQAAVHADHLQEALHIQKQEIERRYFMELDEQLLQQKGVFISEISGSMSKLKEIEDYLKARARLNEAARKTQALWLACQAMKNSIKSGFSEKPKPLGKELAIIKRAAVEESPFVTTVLSGIPLEAVERGVYTDEYLKHRFNKVKRICRRVAMVDNNNRSLYRYLLSYLQSLLIIDIPVIPTAELENKVAVDPSEWDTFDILNRISFCLQRNDMEQALRYANQLRGEPYNVAKDWISELQLLLETSQAVDCLIAYASAIGVQAYH